MSRGLKTVKRATGRAVTVLSSTLGALVLRHKKHLTLLHSPLGPGLA
jgi:hypothetical protein